MARSVFLVALASLAPALAQYNTTYKDYSTDPNPDLDEQTIAVFGGLSFPDCTSGPLSQNLVCNSSATPQDRAAALVSLFTLEELVNSTGNDIPAIPRLGLPVYQVWNEALHGLDRANTSDAGAYSWATSFPSPILSMSALNRTLINQIGQIISTQARAFNNAGKYGLDLKIIATAKHFAGYDIENWGNHSRLGNDLSITQQDLAEYFTPQFVAAVRDAKVHSVMASYNAVNGVPSSANPFLLQTLLRDAWEFGGFVTSDCDSVYNVFNPHGYANNISAASAVSMLAGNDMNCGTSYQYNLNQSVQQGLISRSGVERGVTRFYENLVRLGYFEGNTSLYRDLDWSSVTKTDAWNISYEAAVEGIVLLKNDGTLPLSKSIGSVALIGPWANATTQLQGNYFGPPPYLISPLAALQASHLSVNYAFGTNISSDDASGFAAAVSAARDSDAIIFAGGIDNTIEAEGLDRESISWPGNQLDLIQQLSSLGKPLIVLQMGGGQVDSSSLQANANVNSIIWGGYPGQSGGQALLDIITGARAPAGRLTTTQYPAEYAQQFPAIDMSLRPNGTNPGQTYMWYTGTPVYEFGHGLFYTTFNASLPESHAASCSYDIAKLLPDAEDRTAQQAPFLNFTAEITNTGNVLSDYTAMLFANTTAGPRPLPNKWLVGFDRLGSLQPHDSQTLVIPVSLDNVARTDSSGNKIVYPGKYELALNTDRSVVVSFTLTGCETVLTKWPQEQ
ncbi:hypothetical protein N7468_007716 [Penicillium chermesinum]|uniref:xylan 1,4-beta-xylosidase n=1 Tax=Penicillium chermesinum TaxID=63820 RepID=A0A9W9TKU0_9EURO|nr:uncharacterized protein N7468_007716 [Penicillium chermesinum]KAJ5226491.1 hypothetical protein N7468_007716 [Penicillium chermesinum]